MADQIIRHEMSGCYSEGQKRKSIFQNWFITKSNLTYILISSLSMSTLLLCSLKIIFLRPLDTSN